MDKKAFKPNLFNMLLPIHIMAILFLWY
ncbi:MAG: hypothetical protein ACI9F1_000869 [Colwellia sp.]